VRVFYAQGLWRKPNAESSTQLLPLLSGDTPTAIKIAAALAIGYAGNPANDAKLTELLDDPSARRYAAMAVVLGGNEDQARKLLEILPKDRDTEEVLRLAVTSTEDDNFNLIMKTMFESGQIYRRLRVAEILKQGTGEVSYSYPWVQITTRLRSGWEGPGGMSEREIREAMFDQLKSQDGERRRIAAVTLGAMNLRGLLLAARDAGVKEARQVIMDMDRPREAAELL